MFLAKHKEIVGLLLTMLGVISCALNEAGAGLMCIGLGLALVLTKENPFDLSDTFADILEDESEIESEIENSNRKEIKTIA